MNPFKIQQTTTSLFINFSQKHNTPTYMNFGIWIHYQQQLIIHFTCTITTSTSKHELTLSNSNNHLIPKSLIYLTPVCIVLHLHLKDIFFSSSLFYFIHKLFTRGCGYMVKLVDEYSIHRFIYSTICYSPYLILS